jgi:phosphatidylethanolamine/phosphatidyl-N-methylethanolamine N-methyltransferase
MTSTVSPTASRNSDRAKRDVSCNNIGAMSVAELLYGSLAPVYDLICGALLQPGRRRAMALLNPRPGERILEVGVGTGYGINDYPAGCRVVAIDLSRAMIARTTRRLDDNHRAMVALAQMDAAHLGVKDGCFDAVYVPHTINVVKDPMAVGRELLRVCKPEGRILFLGHFDGIPETSNLVNNLAGKIATAADVNWYLRLETFLRGLGMRATAIESVNAPRLSSIVVCERTSVELEAD